MAEFMVSLETYIVVVCYLAASKMENVIFLFFQYDNLNNGSGVYLKFVVE